MRNRDRFLYAEAQPVPENPLGPEFCRIRVWSGEELPPYDEPEGWCDRKVKKEGGTYCSGHSKRQQRGQDMRIPLGKKPRETS